MEIGGTDADVGLAISAFAITALFVRPLVGRLVDTWGRKRVALLGCVIFSVAPLAYPLAHSVAPLVLTRLFHGLGIACFSTASMTWVADLVPPARRAEAMGYFGNASLVAIALSPVLGAAIQASFGFGVLFLVSAAIGAVGVLACMAAREEVRTGLRAATGGSFHEAALRLDVLGMTLAQATAAGCWGILIAFLAIFSAQRGIPQATSFFTLYALATVLFRIPIGRIADRLGKRVVIAPALFLLGATMLLFTRLSSLAMLYGLALLYGLSFGSIYPTMSALLVDVAPLRVRGAAVGVFTAGFDLGIAVGTYAGGLVAEVAGLSMTFAGAGLLCLVGLLVFLVSTRRTGQRRDGVGS